MIMTDRQTDRFYCFSIDPPSSTFSGTSLEGETEADCYSSQTSRYGMLKHVVHNPSAKRLMNRSKTDHSEDFSYKIGMTPQ